MNIRTALKGACAPVAISVALAAHPALAQDAPANKPAPVTTAATSSNSQGGTATSQVSQSETIVVTGSRIPRPEIETASPIMSVTSENITESGSVNLTDYLIKIPALSASLTAYDNSGDRAGIGYTGLNLLNLRNLGVDRTLVLIDGKRQVASVDGSQAVDINTIPTELIDRVDVLTGGASAVYGADGVSGVVNFVMKKNFEGITASGQTGISSHGDAGQSSLSLTAGKNFGGGRGNIAVAWEHSTQNRLSTQDRAKYRGTAAVRFFLNPDYTAPGSAGVYKYIPLNDVRYFDTSRQGGIDTSFDGFPNFYGANATPYDPGRYIPNYYQQGGSGTLVSDYANDLRPKVRNDVFDAFMHYDFSPAMTLYGEVKYVHTKDYSLGQPTWDYYLFIPSSNPYIPDAVRPYIQYGGVLVNRDDFDFGRRGEAITRDLLRTVVGAKGDLATNLHYDISWDHGVSSTTNHYVGDILSDRFYAAIDAVQTSSGITCAVNLNPNWVPDQPYAYTRTVLPPTTFSPTSGDCKPLDLFGENIASNAAAIAWITADTTDRAKLHEDVVTGSITGDTGTFFKLPGGPVGFAVGGEYRREASSFTADPLAKQGLTFANSLGDTAGNFNVKEAFGELNLPIFKDVPFAKRLNVDAAYRYSDYSTVGTNATWKIGATWAPINDITFRATYARAVRAPNINELYGANSQTYEFIDDPCGSSYVNNGTQYRVANCQTLLSSLGVANPSTYTDSRSFSLPGFVKGNPDVKQEVAKTWTAGVVLQPSALRHFFLTIDWYDITIENAINTVTPQRVAELCVDSPTLQNQYCSSITRENGGNTPGYITSFIIQPLNVADFKTSGLEATLDYKYRTKKIGTFGLHMVGSYLNHLSYVPVPGADPVIEAQQPRAPRYQGTADISWMYSRFKLNWRVNYASATYRFSQLTIDNTPNLVAPQYLKYDALFSHDVFFSVDATDKVRVYGGVNNVFNQQPSLGAYNTPISAVGRFFFVGVKIRLPDALGG